MAMRQADTTAEAAQLQRTIINKKSVSERADMLDSLCAGITQIAETGIRRQHPNATDGEVMVHLLERRYGHEFVDTIPASEIEKIKNVQRR